MRTVGMFDGMSWNSTAGCQRLANKVVRARRDGVRSARVLLDSGSIADVQRLPSAGPPSGQLREGEGRTNGNVSTSRMVVLSVSSITSRSTPMPMPPAGGMPVSRA